MNRVTAWLLLLLIAPVDAFARFDASINATTISAADTLRLTLRADSANVSGNPDVDALAEHFEVLSSQRSSQYRSINGVVDAWTTWTLLLKPKHAGQLQIPPISLSNETSQPIDITVKDLDPQLKRAIAQTVFFETQYEPKQVYVQSQVVVTRRLFYVSDAQLYGDMPNLPEVPGATVQSLGETVRSSAVRNGRQYGLIEQRFAVFPERSGELTVPQASVTGSARLGADFSGGDRRIAVDVTSETLKIPVLPIPPEYPRDSPWLPATDVEVLEDWPGQPQRGLATGTPSQRTLIVRAQGNAAAAIPPLGAVLPDSLKAYPEPPELSDTQTRSGIVGTRTESTSLVATAPGTLTLPQVQLTWFDTVHQQVKTATLPARTVDVTGAAAGEPRRLEPAEPVAAPQSTVPAEAERPTLQDAAPSPTIARWLAAAALALLGAAYAAWRLRRRRSAPVDAHRQEAAAYRALQSACRDGGDPKRIRSALDAWLPLHYHVPLADAARRFAVEAGAHHALNALNALLYQRDAAARFDAAALRRCVETTRGASRTRVQSDVLPALYPSP